MLFENALSHYSKGVVVGGFWQLSRSTQRGSDFESFPRSKSSFCRGIEVIYLTMLLTLILSTIGNAGGILYL